MTIQQALAAVHEVRPSNFEDALLVRWLSDLDGRIANEIFDEEMIFEGERSEPGAAEAGTAAGCATPGSECGTVRSMPYDPDEDQEMELLAPFPYDNVYVTWLMAMIDFHNAEYGRYNNEMIMFNTQFIALGDRYSRMHAGLKQPEWIRI